MNLFHCLLLTLLFVFSAQSFPVKTSLNSRPIIGILTQPGPQSNQQYIAASYVKYLESAGARVVPIFYNQTSETLATLLTSLNGVLFTGGSASLSPTGTFYKSAKLIFDTLTRSYDAGVTIPLWGTCLGFELIHNIVAGEDVLGSVDAENYTVPLQFLPNYQSSKMFGSASSPVLINLETLPITMNNHQFSVYPSTYDANKTKLSSFFNMLSKNVDRQGVEFVSSVEGIKYPVFATQWHPEKPQFEWVNEVINHSNEATEAMQYIANFLVSQARLNNQTFPTTQAENAALIYNYGANLRYTGASSDASFEQTYIW